MRCWEDCYNDHVLLILTCLTHFTSQFDSISSPKIQFRNTIAHQVICREISTTSPRTRNDTLGNSNIITSILVQTKFTKQLSWCYAIQLDGKATQLAPGILAET
ncbi:hypothetical protein CW304_24275 [Bacillus sp. UFRGS-B20]|nr:hypothetical protein CW304_24275 [Bacillus sp. UFRGS-B20]